MIFFSFVFFFITKVVRPLSDNNAFYRVREEKKNRMTFVPIHDIYHGYPMIISIDRDAITTQHM